MAACNHDNYYMTLGAFSGNVQRGERSLFGGQLLSNNAWICCLTANPTNEANQESFIPAPISCSRHRGLHTAAEASGDQQQAVMSGSLGRMPPPHAVGCSQQPHPCVSTGASCRPPHSPVSSKQSVIPPLSSNPTSMQPTNLHVHGMTLLQSS